MLGVIPRIAEDRMSRRAPAFSKRLWISLWQDSRGRWLAECHPERDDALEELDDGGAVSGAAYAGTLEIDGDLPRWDDIAADLDGFRADREADARHFAGLRRWHWGR